MAQALAGASTTALLLHVGRKWWEDMGMRDGIPAEKTERQAESGLVF